jgi:hypothetical protein
MVTGSHHMKSSGAIVLKRKRVSVMSDTQVNECLSFADAFFLYLEQPGAPLNVAAISAFDGIISLAPCMEYVNSKLPSAPRLLQRVIMPPLNIGPPTLHREVHSPDRKLPCGSSVNTLAQFSRGSSHAREGSRRIENLDAHACARIFPTDTLHALRQDVVASSRMRTFEIASDPAQSSSFVSLHEPR